MKLCPECDREFDGLAHRCPACRARHEEAKRLAEQAGRRLAPGKASPDVFALRSLAEVADQLECTTSAVHATEVRAIKKMRQRAKPEMMEAIKSHFVNGGGMPGGVSHLAPLVVGPESEALAAEMRRYLADWDHLASELAMDGGEECAELAEQVRRQADELRRIYYEPK